MSDTPQHATREIQFNAGDESTILDVGEQLSKQIGQDTPSLNNAIFRALLSAQGLARQVQVGSLQAQISGRQEQVSRAQTTPESLIGASPQQQAQVRGARVAAVEPSILGAQATGETLIERIGGLQDALGIMQELQSDKQDFEIQQKEGARNIIFDTLNAAGSGAFAEADPKDIANLEKLAGFSAGTIASFVQQKQKEEERFTEREELELDLLKARTAAARRSSPGRAPTGSELFSKAVSGTQDRFALSREERGGDFLDGNVFLDEMSRSQLDPDEFVARFQHQLSPDDPVRQQLPDVGFGGGVISFGTAGIPIDFEDQGIVASLPIGNLSKAVINDTIQTKDLTSKQKGAIAEDFAKIGYNPKLIVVQKVKRAVALWDKIPDRFKGPIQGRVPFISNFSPEVAEFNALVKPLTRFIARLNDVGVLTDQDVRSYEETVPQTADVSLEVIEGRVRGLEQFFGIDPSEPGQAPLQEEAPQQLGGLQSGEIRVRLKQDYQGGAAGQEGFILEGEFDPNIHERI